MSDPKPKTRYPLWPIGLGAGVAIGVALGVGFGMSRRVLTTGRDDRKEGR